MSLSFTEMETVYEALAGAIDQAGDDHAALFLTKLALFLAKDMENSEQVLAAIRECLRSLGREQA
ncbi:MAG: DUF2783 domain-containing protein [Rhizobiales bacterium PAR1]|nr:MAG: DUF2783 domain-containing protein [Rhizobiales bacterium PAR1]